MECNYLIFWRLVVILIGPPPSDRSKGETGSCCKSMHLLSLFFLLAALTGAEQRGVARLFSCGHPVAWWYLRRHRLARLLAILQLPVVVWLTASFGGFAVTSPLLSYSAEVLLLQAIGSFVAFSLQVVGCFAIVWHRLMTWIPAASFVHLPRFLVRGE